MIPFPDKQYDIIYADPAWSYRDTIIGRDGKKSSRAAWHYPTMTMTELKALPVHEIAADDCLLFLWVISPDLLECAKVGEHWGFEFKQIAFVWDKKITVVGHYTMTQCELCLVFKRGDIPKPRGKKNMKQFLSVKRGRHSEKPLEVKHRITEMFPEQQKIELFARRALPLDDGWDYWGNEV